MAKAWRNTLRLGGLTIISVFALEGQALASDDTQREQTAAKSFETILQKASEQGFIDVGVNTPDINQERPEDSHTPTLGAENKKCTDSSVFDFIIYQSVKDYDDIKAAKSQVKDIDVLSGVLTLAKTYLSLGLGEEAIKLVEPYKSFDARALESLGRTISGYPNQTDKQRLNAYAVCHTNAELWALMSTITYSEISSSVDKPEISATHLEALAAMPPQLKDLISIRLGIYAAEIGDFKTAEMLLTESAPETRNGKVPDLSDDGRLYLFALVQRAKHNPIHLRVLETLAQYDGLYRAKALQQLAEENTAIGGELYSDYTDDLKSVSHQYSGRVESRQAALQVIKGYVTDFRYTDAIDLAKKQTIVTDIERSKAVAEIGDNILTHLRGEEYGPRLYALNGYLYSSQFLAEYEFLDNLKHAAIGAAISLNLPELSVQIIADNQKLPQNIQQEFLRAQAQAAFKGGDYAEVERIAKKSTDDHFLNSLLLKTALLNFSEIDGEALFTKIPLSTDRLKDQVSLAWQTGNWSLAQTALHALSADSQNDDLLPKIAIVDYVGLNARSYLDRPSLKTAKDLDDFTDQLNFDITTVKDYLKNG